MFQALRSLAVLPDDEQAYLQHHKNEAEKRYVRLEPTSPHLLPLNSVYPSY